MNWTGLKAALLAEGTARLTGVPVDTGKPSHAGPGAGGRGSVFFSPGGDRRIRLSVDDESPVELEHLGGLEAVLRYGGVEYPGRIEPAGLHCPRQAYITVSESCIFSCLYCNVPLQEKRVKTPAEVAAMIEGVAGTVDCISITSGVTGSPREEEERVSAVIREVKRFGLPIGVSIYPVEGTAGRLCELGVAEVKFNLETATGELFAVMCPGHDRDGIIAALRDSVPLFGKNHVFTNIILGLGETPEEMKECIRKLCEAGIIPVIRPLTPKAGVSGYSRPPADLLIGIFEFLKDELAKNGLEPCEALTMCPACTGCDMTPGRDG